PTGAIRQPMNSHEQSFNPAAAAMPAAPARNRRRRWLAAGIAVVLVVGAGFAALWYFRLCGNCNGPILCTDPCTLPTFSERPGSVTFASSDQAPAPPPHRAS